MSYHNNNNNNNNDGGGISSIHNVTIKHLLETFGNENPRQAALLPQLYTERQTYSQKIPMLQKDRFYYSASIKKSQRKTTLSSTKNNIRKPVLLKYNNNKNSYIHNNNINNTNNILSETLSLYGELLREIFDKPLLLSAIYYNPAYKYLEPIVKLLTEALLSNQFDESQEHILTNIMEDIMTYEFKNTEDLTTYLRENTAATKMLGAYLKREPVSEFVNKIVEEACNHCLQKESEDLEIDPSAVKS